MSVLASVFVYHELFTTHCTNGKCDTDLGHVQSASDFSAGGSKVSDCSLDGKQQKQQSYKNRHSVSVIHMSKHVGRREVN